MALGTKLLDALLLIVAAFLLYFGFTESPIDSAPYSPPTAPGLTGVLAPNNELKRAKLLGLGILKGPEDVEVDREGRVYSGTSDGKIIRVLENGTIETFADTKGRPLGLHFDKDENLVVCDASKGLLSIDKKGTVSVLTTRAGGLPIALADDLDIATDGTIYFSDASAKYPLADFLLELLEAKPYGRLLRYNPRTKVTDVLLTGLYFANGVALSHDEAFVVVNESFRYRITRYWLKGPNAGHHDIFLDNLPGFPDNISANGKGAFWLAFYTVRNSLADFSHPHPWMKNLVARLPRFLWPRRKKYGLVLKLDETGTVIKSLHDPDGSHLHEVTSAKEFAPFLYLGSIGNDRIGKIRLK